MSASNNGTLSAVDDAVTVANNGNDPTVAIQIGGTFTGVQLAFEGLVNNSTRWSAIAGEYTDLSAAMTSSPSSLAAAASWRASILGFTKFRVRLVAISTGSVSVYMDTSPHAYTPGVLLRM